MIFVITGTGQWPFDRLVKEVDRLIENDIIKEKVFIQLGSCTYEPKHCLWERFLSFGEMCKGIEEANTVLAHACAGITLLSIQIGHQPIIIPRRKKYGELVDDHQLSFSNKIKTTRLVKVIYDIKEIENTIQNTKVTNNGIIQKSKHYYQLSNYLNQYAGYG